jgi:hypothetical protein
VNHDDLLNLAPIYALGALDGEDLDRFTRHLAGCDECRSAVREYERVAGELAQSPPPVPPPPAVKEALLARVRAHKPSAPRSHAAWRPVAAAAVLLVCCVTLSILHFRARSDLIDRQGDITQLGVELDKARWDIVRLEGHVRHATNRSEVSERELAERRKDLERLAKMDALIRDIKSQVLALKGTGDAPDATGRIVWKGREVVFVTSLPALVEGKVYELWALVDGKPVPAGTYDARGNLVNDYWKVPEGAAIAGFAISLEDRPVDTPTKVVMVPQN